MAEVGTYTPPLVTFGPVSPVALLILLTGFLSNKGVPKAEDIGDGRWNTIINKMADWDAVREVEVQPVLPDQD